LKGNLYENNLMDDRECYWIFNHTSNVWLGRYIFRIGLYLRIRKLDGLLYRRTLNFGFIKFGDNLEYMRKY
jgi:hypothetical protein